MNVKKTMLTMVCCLALLLTGFLSGCDEVIEGNPDFWANSYFGQTSPYPMGLLNPIKKEYKYSIPWSVTQTNDSGYLLGGLLRTFKENNAMLFKLNSKGVVEKGFIVHDGTKAGEDRQSGVVTNTLDNGDGYIVSGWLSRDSSGNLIKSNTCMWVMKLDYSGNIIWNKAHGLTSYYEDKDTSGGSSIFMNGVTYSIAKTNDGGFIVAGKHLVKLNSLGEIEWSKTSTSEVIKNVKVTSDGGFIMTAYSGQYQSNSIIKTDEAGTILWSREYHLGDLKSGFTGVEVITNEAGEETGYLLGGEVIYPENRNSDALLLAVDTDGDILWNATFNSVVYDGENKIFSEENISSVIQSNDGSYLVGITAEGFEEELNDDNPVVVKITANGTILWEKAYDVCGARLTKMEPTSKGFVFTGDLDSTGDWHSIVVTCDNDGNVPDHGSDLTIRNVQFMVGTPEGYIVDTTGDERLKTVDLVSVDLRSYLREVTTERARR